MNIDGDLLQLFVEYQSGAISALVPLIASVAGVFLAFAIAHSVRFFIQRSVKK